MNAKSLRAVRARALRVARLCKKALVAHETDNTLFICGSRLTGELRRASMDLTRALADMRKAEAG